MKTTLLLLIAIAALSSYFALIYPRDFYGEDPFVLARAIAGSGVAVCAALGYVIFRLQSAGKLSTSGEEGEQRRAKVVLLFVSVVALLALVPRLGLPIGIAAAFPWLLLMGAGVLLAKPLATRSHVPVLFTTVTFVALTTVQAVHFVSNEAVQFRFGPERFLFAGWTAAGDASWLPLQIAACWLGWLVANAVAMRRSSLG